MVVRVWPGNKAPEVNGCITFPVTRHKTGNASMLQFGGTARGISAGRRWWMETPGSPDGGDGDGRGLEGRQQPCVWVPDWRVWGGWWMQQTWMGGYALVTRYAWNEACDWADGVVEGCVVDGEMEAGKEDLLEESRQKAEPAEHWLFSQRACVDGSSRSCPFEPPPPLPRCLGAAGNPSARSVGLLQGC